MEQSYLLTYLLAVPIVGSLLILFINKEKSQLIKNVGLAVSLLAFIISLIIYFDFDNQSIEFQFVNRFNWISGLNISYHAGIDGLINGLAKLVEKLSGSINKIQTGVAQSYALVMVLGILIALFWIILSYS